MLVINMASHKIFILFFITFVVYSPITQAQVNFVNRNCSTHTFAANSSFQSDLTTLFSSLTSNKTAKTQFYNATVARGGDSIYGLFMCRGDVTPEVCRQCVVNATQLSTSTCPFSKEAVVYYEECLVRYSYRSFFSTVDTRPRLWEWNSNNISRDQARFKNLLMTTLNAAADEAAKHALGKMKFATKEASLEYQTLYNLVQCTPDLSPEDCRRCLRGVIGDLHLCCEGSIGGKVLYPSCNLRYELYSFYNSSNRLVVPTPPPPAALSPPTNSSDPHGKGQSARTIVIIVASLVAAGLLSCFAYYLLKNQIERSRRAVLRQKYFGSESNTLEPLQFSLATIEAVTNKFSEENSLGQGGFGQVYKGMLSNGQEIAVKRLSKESGQGAEEFKNEVLLIARLQHRNLVTFLGFCIEEQEKILIYEYVPNRSLDHFLFGFEKNRGLNWVERYKIIGGVARGILYLHEYSRLKIIHRDLKPSNILLDNEMNPKISDFGMAKMVAINEKEESTKRIVGTYGYMSPEYAMFGQYSEKSDIFSFGVIVLEIISGKKNASCHDQSQYADSLLSYAWNQWRDEKLLEMLDSNLKELGSYDEVIKCIHIGLLCVQKNPEARPSMATVVSYLSDDSIQLPSPQEPALFFLHRRMGRLFNGKKESCSINQMSISELLPR